MCGMKSAPTGSVVDVGHGATFGVDVAHVDLLGLDLDLWTAAESTKQLGFSGECAIAQVDG